jgi:predicted sugar kinase
LFLERSGNLMTSKENKTSTEVKFTFNEFPPGYVRYPVVPSKEVMIKYQQVKCQIPARFGTLLINPSKFAHPSRPYFYDVSNLNFAVNVYTQAEVTLTDKSEIIIDPSVERPLIAQHAAELIRKATGVEEIGLKINVRSDFKTKHVGLATSAAIQHSVAYAVNKALGEPLSREQLVTYLAQNNAEESDKPGFLISEPSTGGLGAVCLWGGGVVFLGDEMKIVGQTKIPENYTYVLGLPSVLREERIEEIEDNYARVVAHHDKVDREWGTTKKEMVENELIPAFEKNNIKTIGRIVFDYTLNRYGDVQTAFDLTCPGVPMAKYMNSLKKLQTNEEIISAFVSSTGPNIVILTTKPEIAADHLISLGIENILYLHPDNVGVTYECR